MSLSQFSLLSSSQLRILLGHLHFAHYSSTWPPWTPPKVLAVLLFGDLITIIVDTFLMCVCYCIGHSFLATLPLLRFTIFMELTIFSTLMRLIYSISLCVSIFPICMVFSSNVCCFKREWRWIKLGGLWDLEFSNFVVVTLIEFNFSILIKCFCLKLNGANIDCWRWNLILMGGRAFMVESFGKSLSLIA